MTTIPPKTDPGHAVADQSEVFDFLSDPATHGRADIVRIDTHGAMVILAGPDAWKIKRAVLFPFMDFSTLEKRRRACIAEVEINAPNAPGLYLGAVPVTREPGGLALGGTGEAVEWAVHMRRFDETATLDIVAERGLDPSMVDAVTDAVLASHASAPTRPGGPAVDALARYLDQDVEAFSENAQIFPPDQAALLDQRARAHFSATEELMRRRGEAGFVRRCHGDLHLRNIAVIDGRPRLFDAVEFDEAIATGDVLYDLAFLLMDLCERDHRPEANRLLNRYLRAAALDMIEGLAALPLFLSIRAAIRAKVVAAALPRLTGDARRQARLHAKRYFELAGEALEPAPLLLVAVGGLSGSGKSTIARGLAPDVGRLPGAVHLASDSVRKALAGVPEGDRLPPSAYGVTAGETVYEELRRRAAGVLATGQSAIVDAVHARPSERAAIADVAAAAGAAFLGIWLDAPQADLERRVEKRTEDVSDATVDVVRRQADYDLGDIGWTRIDATGPVETVLAEVRRLLKGK